MVWVRVVIVELLWTFLALLAFISGCWEGLKGVLKGSADRIACTFAESIPLLIAVVFAATIICGVSSAWMLLAAFFPQYAPAFLQGVVMRVVWFLFHSFIALWSWFIFIRAIDLIIWRESMRSAQGPKD